jgi:hypothetical protein
MEYVSCIPASMQAMILNVRLLFDVVPCNRVVFRFLYCTVVLNTNLSQEEFLISTDWSSSSGSVYPAVLGNSEPCNKVVLFNLKSSQED